MNDTLIAKGKGPQRCPHDGGKCHHLCLDECYRKRGHMSLSTPWQGFPKDTDAPIQEPMPSEVE